MGIESIFEKIGTISESIWDKGVGAISSNVNYSQEAIVGVIIIITILWYLLRGRK